MLLPNRLSREGKEIPFVSDFFDFSVFLDASEELLEKWYVERFMRLRDTAFRDPRSFFKKFADLDDADGATRRRATSGGASISSTCTRTSCRPARARACRLIKGASHRIEQVALRKL